VDKRRQFAALFDDAAKRKFDCVLFWALDHFSREGMTQTIVHLQRLASYDVGFHSYAEPHLATDNELVRNILLALLSSLARVEAHKIGERTKAGMARAEAKGIKIGRPKLDLELRQKIAQRAAKGEAPYAIAKSLGIERHTAGQICELSLSYCLSRVDCRSYRAGSPDVLSLLESLPRLDSFDQDQSLRSPSVRRRMVEIYWAAVLATKAGAVVFFSADSSSAHRRAIAQP
jgi:hypothetical protein